MSKCCLILKCDVCCAFGLSLLRCALLWNDIQLAVSLCVCITWFVVFWWIFETLEESLTTLMLSNSKLCISTAHKLNEMFGDLLWEIWLLTNNKPAVYGIFCHYQKWRLILWYGPPYYWAKQVMLPQIKSALNFAVLPKRTIANDRLWCDEFMELLLLMCYSLTSFVDFSLGWFWRAARWWWWWWYWNLQVEKYKQTHTKNATLMNSISKHFDKVLNSTLKTMLLNDSGN